MGLAPRRANRGKEATSARAAFDLAALAPEQAIRTRRFEMRLATLAALMGLFGLAGPALALDKVKFGTNWLADPAAGGFFQAVADGTYSKYGLDVTIVPGGPQSNGALLLLYGKLEFYMGSDMIGNFHWAEAKTPLIAVAADFQKSPQALMSHPGVGMDKWEDLPRAKPVYLGAAAITTFYAWLKLEYGFKDENIRPYNFNSAPFIANKNSIQQGYVTGEPFVIERQGHFIPNLFLLSDYGYDTYATLIVTRTDIVKKKPDLVQRFVDASAIGWYHYLYGDNSNANALIKADNPDLTDDYIAFAITEMKKYGIVDSGDALKLGIGAMTDAQWKDFFGKMVEIGLVDKRTNYKNAYTLQFVDKKVGVDLHPQ
jgi:NitT/TauT family transport system substrate-binding protein